MPWTTSSASLPSVGAFELEKPYYTPDNYSVECSVGYLIKRAHLQMLDCVESIFAQQGYTFTQWLVLKHIREGKGVNPKHISHAIRHDSGALTRVLDQLESRSLIERHRCADDRRAVEIHLTAAGEQVCDELMPLLVERLNAALGTFTHSEIDELIRLLKKLIVNIETGSQPEEPVGEVKA